MKLSFSGLVIKNEQVYYRMRKCIEICAKYVVVVVVVSVVVVATAVVVVVVVMFK